MKQIEKVRLLFENCETIEFTGDDIHFLYFDNIHIGEYQNVKDIRCQHFNIAFKLTANDLYHPFGISEMEPKRKFDRMSEFKDLVSVKVRYIDGTEEHVYIMWNDAVSEEENVNQTVNVDEKYFYVIG